MILVFEKRHRMYIRMYLPKDISEVTELLYNTVHTINLRDYSSAEVEAWAPKEIDKAAWNRRLSDNFTVVAEKDGIIVGFASLANKEYYDLLYIHKDYQRQGIASALTYSIEYEAALCGISELTADVSITAKPFFERMGYEVIREQSVERKGKSLTNYKMRKGLKKIY
jgi:putative acetyltransferase